MNRPAIMYTFLATVIEGDYKGQTGSATYENDSGNIMIYFNDGSAMCLQKEKIKYERPVAKRDVVRAVLAQRSCVSAQDLARWIKRDIGLTMTPSAVAGVLRPMVSSGEVGSSNCGYGSTVYWVNETAVSEI